MTSNSDKETLAKMFKKAGIQYDEDPYDNGVDMFQIIRDGRNHVGGYSGFMVDFIFDGDNLKAIDIWE